MKEKTEYLVPTMRDGRFETIHLQGMTCFADPHQLGNFKAGIDPRFQQYKTEKKSELVFSFKVFEWVKDSNFQEAFLSLEVPAEDLCLEQDQIICAMACFCDYLIFEKLGGAYFLIKTPDGVKVVHLIAKDGIIENGISAHLHDFEDPAVRSTELKPIFVIPNVD